MVVSFIICIFHFWEEPIEVLFIYLFPLGVGSPNVATAGGILVELPFLIVWFPSIFNFIYEEIELQRT